MIPINKYILNRKQKRAALVSCTLFAFMGFMVSMPLCYRYRFPEPSRSPSCFIQCYRTVQGKARRTSSATRIGKERSDGTATVTRSGHVFQPCFSPQLTNYKFFILQPER